MDIIAAPELIVERTLVVSAIIIMLGVVSIGGLWLWKRLAINRRPRFSQVGPANEFDGEFVDGLLRLTTELERTAEQTRRRLELASEEIRHHPVTSKTSAK